MAAALAQALTPAQQNRLIELTVRRERGRLLRLIRASIADAADAEDILQDVFYELVRAARLMQPVEQVGAWLARVARNRIIDRSRRRRGRPFVSAHAAAHGEDMALEELLPAPNAEPESAAMRELLLDQLELALAELPPEQRAVFIEHELDGVSFRELAARSGVSINTLLARKHYAMRALRARLRAVWDEWLMSE
jgi:RNA polymerase sigma factor (sigma-70 family)